jgi:hypothetical protein
MPQTEIAAPPAARARLRIGARAQRLADRLILAAHRLAERLERVPSEFGKAGPVDEGDAGAVANEWLRCLRLWADYNPEELFALKAGAAVLAVVLVGFWLLVGLVR